MPGQAQVACVFRPCVYPGQVRAEQAMGAMLFQVHPLNTFQPQVAEGLVPPVVPDAAFHFNERAAGQMGKIRLPSPLGMKTVLPQEFRAFQKLP